LLPVVLFLFFFYLTPV